MDAEWGEYWRNPKHMVFAGYISDPTVAADSGLYHTTFDREADRGRLASGPAAGPPMKKERFKSLASPPRM